MVVDGIFLAVLLISALISFMRGFIREVLTILGVVGGLAAAYIGGPILAPMIKGWLGVVEGEDPQRLFGALPYTIIGDILSYGLVFIVVVVLLSFISHFLAEGVRAIGLGAIDRTLGIVFGLARGLLLMGMLYLPIHIGVDDKTKNEWFADSRGRVYMEMVAGGLESFLPESAVRNIDDTVNGENPAYDNLKALDVLRNGGVPVDENGQEKNSPDAGNGASGNGAPGYTPEFRQEMDQLFKKDPAAKPTLQSPPPHDKSLQPAPGDTDG